MSSTLPYRAGASRRRPKAIHPSAKARALSLAGAPAPSPQRAPIAVPTGEGSFAGLGVDNRLCEVLARQGLLEPLPIQSAAIPDVLQGRDLLGEGRTGSGKTLAFALPLITRLAQRPRIRSDRRPRALVVVPTRELANQVESVIRPLAAATGLRSATIFGGVGMGPQVAALRAGTEIIVGCPGRLVDHIQRGTLDLGAIEITVLDEADHMADVGFLPMVIQLLTATPANSQRLLFSATLDNDVDRVVKRFLREPASHRVAAGNPVEVDHTVVVIHPDHRLATLVDLVGERRAVVFTRTKHRAKQLARSLSAADRTAVELHGNLSQEARTANLRRFAHGSAQFLVATDIAARGIHIDEIPLVVHADPPAEHKSYLHRSGRTARAGATGSVLTLVPREQVNHVETLLRRSGISATWIDADASRAPVAPRASAAGRRVGNPRNRMRRTS